jgi:hypothetical protein
VKKAPKQAEEILKLNGDYDAGKAPQVVIPLESIRVPEKQAFKLRCKFSGATPLKIEWFKDGERVYSYSRCTLTENPDGSCELEVPESTRADSGGYRVVASNDFGSARTTGEVTVQLKERQKRNFDDEMNAGKAPGFTIPLTMKKARLGETVTFECLPYGKPFPNIEWMKDGIKLLSSDNAKIEASEDGTQRLIVSNVDALSEGYYRCKSIPLIYAVI